MARLARAFAFLILVISSCLFQTEARPSQFITITASPAPTPVTSEISFPPVSTPALAPAPTIGEISFPPGSAPVSAPEISFPPVSSTAPTPLGDVSPSTLESDSGYGLYGFQSRENPSTETFSESRSTEKSVNNYNNGGYSERHYDKHNGYNVPQRQGMSDTRFMENGRYYYDVSNENSYDNLNNNNNNGYSERYFNNGNGYYTPERQGMSDRFMENDKYYYGVNNENYNQNGYEPVRGNEGYDGNFKNEFDSMEEYEKQHGYPETQTWEDQP